MKCPGCYKENQKGYCAKCRKLLFDGKKVDYVLAFDTPKATNLPDYQEKTKRLSISGVQLKYSLRLENNNLVLTEKGGQYILKPIPPSTFIVEQDQAPENEHLTMQIAKQIFKIPVAENALIYFKDNAPAYITRRFDVKPDGTKHLQEDFAQIGGKTKKSDGDNYKYNGTYEDVGKLIKEKVAAYPSILEEFFKVIVFNYVFSNGDAHLKNFSLIQSEFGDYTLTKAYDLMSTILHTPSESDIALDLYKGDLDSEFYSTFGYFGRSDFETFSGKLGLILKRARHIIDTILSNQNEVFGMINNSFLSDDAKAKYIHNYKDKIVRF
ncbi:MAG: HipA domain-containing protein [Ferruginibacter sp.]